MGNAIGYVRVSSKEQVLSMQQDAMAAAGVEKVFEDHGVSGTVKVREGLEACLSYLREGDTLVVWKLDRLGRNTRNVLELLDTLEQRGIKFRSLTEGLDTAGPMGKAMLTIISAFAALERDTIVERTRSGLDAARARGRVGGRPVALTEKQHKQIFNLYAARTLTIKEIAEMFSVSEPTIYRSLNKTKTSAAV